MGIDAKAAEKRLIDMKVDHPMYKKVVRDLELLR